MINAHSLETLLPTPRRRTLEVVDLAVPPERAWDVVRHLDLGRLPWVQVLYAGLRRALGDRLPRSLRLDELRSTPEQPGPQCLVDEPPQRFVLGALARVQASGTAFVHASGPDAFAAFAEPGAVKVAWSFEIRRKGASDCRLLLECRVDASDAAAWRKARWAFLLWRPVSSLLRRRLLASLAGQLGSAELAHGPSHLNEAEIIENESSDFARQLEGLPLQEWSGPRSPDGRFSHQRKDSPRRAFRARSICSRWRIAGATRSIACSGRRRRASGSAGSRGQRLS